MIGYTTAVSFTEINDKVIIIKTTMGNMEVKALYGEWCSKHNDYILHRYYQCILTIAPCKVE